MATYVVTTSNWNDPSFWSSINEAGAGHTLDFSALPSTYEIESDPDYNYVDITDGTSVFSVGDVGFGSGLDAYLGGSTLLSFFTSVVGTDGDDFAYGSSASETLSGGDGNDSLMGYIGDDSLVGGAGDDLIQGQQGDDTIDGGAGSDTVQASDGSEDDTARGGESTGDQDVLDLVGPSAASVTFTGDEAGTYTMGAASGVFSEFEEIRGTSANDKVDASADSSGIHIDGEGGNDSILGGTGADDLDGGSGDDSLIGGAGDDSLSGGTGADSLVGGADADTFLIEDGFGADTIVGGDIATIGQDFDTLDLSALTGSVTVTFTGAGAGRMTNGTDTLSFTGIERVIGSDQIDTVDASSDTTGVWIVTGDGEDTITGGSGNDTVDGGRGNDTIRGGDGHDSLHGFDGDDSIDGGAGDDIIWGGYGYDTYVGGAGTDTYQIAGSDVDGIAFDVDLQAGTDQWNTLSGIENVNAGTGADTLVGDGNANVLDGGSGNDQIDGGGGSDTLRGGQGADTLSGGMGDDYIEGGAGDDLLRTGSGQDTLLGGEGDDTLLNSAGDDSLVGGAGNDSIVASAGDDTLDGGDGSDTLIGGADSDLILGGEGNDSIRGDDDISYDVPVFQMGVDFTINSGTFEGGTNDIKLSVSESSTALFLDDDGEIGGDSPNETFTDANQQVVIGGVAYQVLFDDTAQFSNDVTGDIYTLAVLDVDLDGSGESSQAGEDGTFLIQIGGPTIPPGANLTSVNGTTDGAPAPYDLTGFETGGADSIDAGSGDDTVTGEFGADTIAGGTGADSLSGGADADTFIVENGFGNDTIVGGEEGTDSDTIDASALTGPVTVTFTGDEAGTITDGTDTITFSEIENVFTGSGDDSLDASADTSGIGLFANEGQDTITGGSGADYIDGGAGDDSITAGAGDDTIDGGAGADRIHNNAGADTVDGGSGDDTLIGGEGNDSLVGGAGSDTFSLDHLTDTDTIVGADDGGDIDRIDFVNGTAGSVSVTFTGNEAGTYSVSGSGSSGSFTQIERVSGSENADTIDASASAVGQILDGDGGDDSIVGSTGDDTITGGEGADQISDGEGNDSVDAGDGNDTIGGWTGNDTFSGGAGDDRIEGGHGADSIDGGTGDDLLVGYDAAGLSSGSTVVGADDGAADTIAGGAGADTIGGGAGADSLTGGADADTFILSDGFGNDTIAGGEAVTTGTDYDTIDLSALTGPVTVTFTGSGAGTITDGTDTVTFSEIERIIGTDQADVIDASDDAEGIVIEGGAGDDTITGGSGGDTIDGEGGADSILGGAGDDALGYAVGGDTIDGQAGADTIRGGFSAGSDDAVLIGGDGNDSIVTYGADDTVYGGDGSDTINADSGNESLDGGAGDDVIWANSGDDTIVGGAGNDSISTGSGNDTIVLADGSGHDTITDFDTGDADADGQYNDQFDVSGMTADDGSPLRSHDVSTTDEGGDARLDFPASTSNSQVSMQGTSTSQMGEGSEYQAAGIPCFTLGTMIATPEGEVPVEVLSPGDLVLTRDNGPQPLLWSAMRRLDRRRLDAAPQLKPIEIAAGAFGNDRPLVVSPQHGVLVTLGQEELLVRARHLANLPGGLVRVRSGCRRVTYCHLFFERHEIVFSNGCPTESYFPGPEALRGLEANDRLRLRAVLPDLPDVEVREEAVAVYGTPARAYAERQALPAHVRDFGALWV